MRIPDLNVSDSVNRTIRDLEFQRLKLDKQITTGQKITLPEDGGLKISQAIKLDSELGRLAQYQRNASYATEFLNAGQMNLDNLRELNLRAQEIARSAGSSLSEPATKSFALEANQLVEESLNRINAAQRGHALFGGNQLKPVFSNTDVILDKFQNKTLDFNANNIGQEISSGVRYLNQGDQISLTVNGLEYIVEAKIPQEQEFSATSNYDKGSIVKFTDFIDPLVPTNRKLENDEISANSDNAELLEELKLDLLNEFSARDWSNSPVGSTSTGEDVYLLDRHQLENLTNRAYSQGGYFTIKANEGEGALFLQPVERSDENDPDLFDSLSSYKTSYWEALSDNISESPFENPNLWQSIDPHERVSNLSLEEVREELSRMINSSTYETGQRIISDNEVFVSRIKKSSHSVSNSNLHLEAKPTDSGLLEIRGAVGEQFELQANYITRFGGNNYFPVQLDKLIREKALLFYPEKEFESLSENERKLLLDDLESSNVSWGLTVDNSSEFGQSTLDLNHYSPWRRLGTYQTGEIVEFQDKLWESLTDDNFHHSPDMINSSHWREIGTGYDVEREDWKIKHVDSNNRVYFTSPDGNLFDDRDEALSHTEKLLSNSLFPFNYTFDDVEILVREVPISVANFSVEGSESQGLVYFDSKSQSYRLSSLHSGDNIVSGTFSHGSVKTESEALDIGDVVSKDGNYFLVLETNTSPDESNPTIIESELSSSIPKGTTVFSPSKNILYLSLSNHLPQQDKETTLTENSSVDLSKGSFVYAQYEDDDGNLTKSYFAATRSIEGATLDDLPKFIPLGPNYTPGNSLDVKAIDQNENVSVFKDDIVKNSSDGRYYKALKTMFNATTEDLDSPFTSVNVFNSIQGSVWTANHTYVKGQVVLHNGVYYECQTSGLDTNDDGIRDGFSNRKTEIVNGDKQTEVLSPSDLFFIDGLEDTTITEEFLDIQVSSGELIKNNVWNPVGNPVQHILSFSTVTDVSAEISIRSAGPSGLDADVMVTTDSNGKVSGLKVSDGGKYFFEASSVPDHYKYADIVLPDGQSFSASIIWGENRDEPGSLEILGFDKIGFKPDLINDPTSRFKEVEIFTKQENSSKIGDTFSFATGSKTFLDHRNENGEVIGVTYTGSNTNSEFYVGKDTKISSFLNSADGNTEDLVNVVNSLIELRDGLTSQSPSELSRRVQGIESELIDNEDSIVDKIGDLTSLLVRMESVRAYDEDYHLQLNQKLSKDLDVDLSQAIMELTRISTAYQAAMQVGAQLLNTSLLNYL